VTGVCFGHSTIADSLIVTIAGCDSLRVAIGVVFSVLVRVCLVGEGDRKLIGD
jgi:hypothetical protein